MLPFLFFISILIYCLNNIQGEKGVGQKGAKGEGVTVSTKTKFRVKLKPQVKTCLQIYQFLQKHDWSWIDL